MYNPNVKLEMKPMMELFVTIEFKSEELFTITMHQTFLKTMNSRL